jgi:HEAT repeat protein
MNRTLTAIVLSVALISIACGSPAENAAGTLMEQVSLGDPLAQGTYAENKELLESAEAVPIWIEALQSNESTQVREWAARILGAGGDETAIPALVAAMSDNRDVREAAIDAIRRYDDTVMATAFIDALRGGNRDAQISALGQIGRLGDVGATAAVAEAARSSEALVSRTAVNTLGDLGGADAVTALGELVTDASVDADARAAALSNLGRIDTPESSDQIAAIITALEGQEDAAELLTAAQQMQR